MLWRFLNARGNIFWQRRVGFCEKLKFLQGSGREDTWVKWSVYKNNQLRGSHYSTFSHSFHSGIQSHLARTSDFPQKQKIQILVEMSYFKSVNSYFEMVCWLNKTCLWARWGLWVATIPCPLSLDTCGAELSCCHAEEHLGTHGRGTSGKGLARGLCCFCFLPTLTKKSEKICLWYQWRYQS